MFHFIKSFLSVKGRQIGKEITDAIVSIDPEGATQAQIEAIEQDLDKTGIILQRIRADYEREVQEANDATKHYNQLLAAAEQLQTKLEDPTTSPTDKIAIEASLNKLVGQVEVFSKDVEQEEQDVIEIKALLDEAQVAYREKAQVLTQAKRNIDRAKRDMQRAMLQVERSEEKAKRAEEVAGLRESNSSKLLVANSAMERRAEKARIKAAVLNMKTEILSSAKQDIAGNDPLVIEALQSAESKSNFKTVSLTERLIALRKKRDQMK